MPLALAAAPEPPAPPPPPPPLEVTVQGARSRARELEESAEAVTVVDTRKAQQQAADLGEVLARTQGVGLRREGGLGSSATLSLDGLQGDQIRFFLDGMPLELAGYPFDPVNVPVNLVERVEIYRGVVPIRFGADALGGAINLVTDQRYETHLGASYQVGSFGTVRTTLSARYRHEPLGLVAGASGFLDAARNDYWMDDRKLATPDGRSVVRTTRRFHDGYRARGATVELGVVDRAWTRRLLLQAFSSTYDKELQHNFSMTTPYGEVTQGDTVTGATLRYEVRLGSQLELELLGNYSHRRRDFRDLGTHIYDWEGQRGAVVGRDGARGEINGEAVDKSLYEDTFYGRVGAAYTLLQGHVLRASVTPQATERVGDDHVEERPELLRLEQRSVEVVSGLEYDLDLFGGAFSNVLFGKDYYFSASAEDRTPVTAVIFEREYGLHRLGGGDALRYRFTPWLLAKISYEYATRLPTPDEIFGDGRLIRASADQYNDQLLKPERSHNLNLGPRLDVALGEGRYGRLVLDVNAFLRESSDMIVLLAGRQAIPYSNLSNARSLGFDGALAWSPEARFIKLEGAFTWQDVRNTSTSGPFEPQRGMRIPSRPYLFASFGARLRFSDLPDPDDTLEPFYYGRYVHGFDRGWDIGDRDFKQFLPAQMSHTAGLTWLLGARGGKLTSSFEVDNLTNAKLFDLFGVQRAGRAIYLKLTGQI